MTENDAEQAAGPAVLVCTKGQAAPRGARRYVMRYPRFLTTPLLISLVTIGCDVESEPVDSEKQFDMSLPEHGDGDEIDVQAFSKDELTEAVPGESPDDPLDAVNCVYVEWCDAPGANGTICRLRSGCVYNAATVNECITDTNDVCGGPVYPWYIY